jgi:Protein of unknown function (DUF1499)
MTGVLAPLLGRVFPACATEGSAGLPVPPPLDFSTLKRPRPKNSALAAAPGLHVLPDIITRPRDVPPRRLYTALCRLALAQPRTTLHVAYDNLLQAHFVARGRLNLPDLIAVQVTPDAMPMLYSRSVYGSIDFGVNRRRLVEWLTALDATLEHA